MGLPGMEKGVDYIVVVRHTTNASVILHSHEQLTTIRIGKCYKCLPDVLTDRLGVSRLLVRAWPFDSALELSKVTLAKL